MKKLDKTFKINPLYEADGYKIGHHAMLAPNTTREYWTWIPRSTKYLPEGIDKVMSAGQQLVVRYLHSNFKELFFDQPIEEALKFGEDMCEYLMMDYNGQHFVDLHKLGYLPIKIKALPEGIFTVPNIPHMTGINTVDGYAWLGLYLETMISKLAWQLPTAATISHKFKQNALEWVKKTDSENLWLADFMNHDFHSRGGNPFTSIAVGLGHAISNSGSDTLNVIPASRYYYDFDEKKVPINSVNASEHSVTCTGIFKYVDDLKSGKLEDKIKEYYSFNVACDGSIKKPDFLAIAEWLNLRDWLERFPKGILSVVSDTFDLWKLITYILPRLKTEILAREGKLVIRPDSGDPVDIICGDAWRVQGFTEGVLNKVKENGIVLNYTDNKYYKVKLNSNYEVYGEETTDVTSANKGVIELLWDIFGGTISKEGFKRLDSHIGAIYGDSINLERQVQIYSRLAEKGFAASNIVLGIGSYTYVMLTRDSAGYAAKGAWFEVKEHCTCEEKQGKHFAENAGVMCCKKSYNIYKDPITDDGTKKSLKGLIAVYPCNKEGQPLELEVKQECTFEEESGGLLQVIYEDGKFSNQTTLTEIRNKLK